MKVLIAASEIVPFAKTGGLADVAGAMGGALERLGVNVSLIMPFYKRVKEGDFDIRDTGARVAAPIRDREVEGRIFKGSLPDTEVPVFFIANDDYYDRDELYGSSEGDYEDNCERFVFFSRAILEAVKELNLAIDVIHCNDWHTGLVPVYLKTLYKQDGKLAGISSLYTIHNLAYQGAFWHWDMPVTGLSWDLFNYKELEFFGKINLMKGGLVFADLISTVSKTYAREIQMPEMGCGLEGVLAWRSSDLFGIVNGIDYNLWSPERDKLIAANYSAEDLSGKKRCKADLQKISDLPVRNEVPLIGMVSRLDNQKGLDLIARNIDELMRIDLQFVLLGTGLKQYHRLFEAIARKYPGRTGIHLKFDNVLAHKIEAGADMFLMPSRFEPCGLNQLYSLKYGTVPVARKTGGLADTIVDCDERNLKKGSATGFLFTDYDAREFLSAIKRALRSYQNKEKWNRLMLTGMSQDWSWDRSAKEYLKLYKRTIEKGKRS